MNDDLDTARGMFNGCVFSSLLWIVIINIGRWLL